MLQRMKKSLTLISLLEKTNIGKKAAKHCCESKQLKTSTMGRKLIVLHNCNCTIVLYFPEIPHKDKCMSKLGGKQRVTF